MEKIYLTRTECGSEYRVDFEWVDALLSCAILAQEHSAVITEALGLDYFHQELTPAEIGVDEAIEVFEFFNADVELIHDIGYIR